MINRFISNVLNRIDFLNNSELTKLKIILTEELKNWNLDEKLEINTNGADKIIQQFLTTKKMEGCSNRTIDYYDKILSTAFECINLEIDLITTEDIRNYLNEYQETNKVSLTTIDNIRRVLSSLFSWLEEEDLILKSPMKRIHKIKSPQRVKETLTDEEIVKLRDYTKNPRDLALIDLLISTGMRVGELVNLDISDINFDQRECLVFGKGSKERIVYFDAQTKLHLKQYLNTRDDDNPALFVSLRKPYSRLKINSIEKRLREIGKRLNIHKLHPHKFRRTIATIAIDKGMPIEQLQNLLGHKKIDTTLQYAMVKQQNVKHSHQKFLC